MKTFTQYTIEQSTMDKHVKRLGDLSRSLTQYKHRWNENPSNRMMSWVDEYNSIKDDHPDAFAIHSKKHGYDRSHNAYDHLA